MSTETPRCATIPPPEEPTAPRDGRRDGPTPGRKRPPGAPVPPSVRPVVSRPRHGCCDRRRSRRPSRGSSPSSSPRACKETRASTSWSGRSGARERVRVLPAALAGRRSPCGAPSSCCARRRCPSPARAALLGGGGRGRGDVVARPARPAATSLLEHHRDRGGDHGARRRVHCCRRARTRAPSPPCSPCWRSPPSRASARGGSRSTPATWRACASSRRARSLATAGILLEAAAQLLAVTWLEHTQPRRRARPARGLRRAGRRGRAHVGGRAGGALGRLALAGRPAHGAGRRARGPLALRARRAGDLPRAGVAAPRPGHGDAAAAGRVDARGHGAGARLARRLRCPPPRALRGRRGLLGGARPGDEQAMWRRSSRAQAASKTGPESAERDTRALDIRHGQVRAPTFRLVRALREAR